LVIRVDQGGIRCEQTEHRVDVADSTRFVDE
jgi:hypothetical protein